MSDDDLKTENAELALARRTLLAQTSALEALVRSLRRHIEHLEDVSK